jgi:5-methylcytosine-specific restriction endonuclease McrA
VLVILRACSCGELHSQGQRCRNYRKPSGRTGSTRYYREQRAVAFARDGQACTVCGATTGLEAHHVIPWAKGGSDHHSNLETRRS